MAVYQIHFSHLDMRDDKRYYKVVELVDKNRFINISEPMEFKKVKLLYDKLQAEQEIENKPTTILPPNYSGSFQPFKRKYKTKGRSTPNNEINQLLSDNTDKL